jgi:Mannosyltransferase (PIG-V)
MIEQEIPTLDPPSPASLRAQALRSGSRTAISPRLTGWWQSLRLPLVVYGVTRLLYLGIALFDTAIHKWSLGAELANWDGVWYVALTNQGYPTHASHAQTTLGFLPLYAIVTWLVSHMLFCSVILAGVVVSIVGGFIATVVIQRLSAAWWGEAAGRRAVLFFCLFPGSIVFSMVYSEGLMLPLAAGCLLALEQRRWWLAGLLAAFATATAPVALAVVPACAVAAGREIYRRGWHDREARRALIAPLLAPAGLLAFGFYLWIWTGTPFASYQAQRYGWGEKSTPFALLNQSKHLVHETWKFHGLHHPGINLNYAAGVFGAIFLLVGLGWMIRSAPRVSPAAIAWTLGTAVLTLTSANTPPNPRMLLCAFPAIMVFAYKLRGQAYARLIAGSTVLLVAMSTVTFVGTALRP